MSDRTATERSRRYHQRHADTINEKKRAKPRTDLERGYARSYYAANRDRIRANVIARRSAIPVDQKRAYGREWAAKDRLRNRAKYLLVSAKQRAAEKGLEFTLTLADIVIPASCPMLGIPIVIKAGAHYDGAPSLDRIDNSLGYTPENVRVISYRANRLKCDMTLEEAKILIANWFAR